MSEPVGAMTREQALEEALTAINEHRLSIKMGVKVGYPEVLDVVSAALDKGRAVLARPRPVPVEGGAAGGEAEIAQAINPDMPTRIRRQVDATRHYLVQNGVDAHFADVLLSHYLDFARELATLSQPAPPSEGGAEQPVAGVERDLAEVRKALDSYDHTIPMGRGRFAMQALERLSAALSQPVVGAADQEALDLEVRAMEIYDGWVLRAGWVPWVPYGNSDMQYEARRQARAQKGQSDEQC